MSVVPPTRPVNELFGSLIDSNSFTISNYDDTQEGEFQRNPPPSSFTLYSSSSSTLTLTSSASALASEEGTALPISSSSSYSSSSITKKLFHRRLKFIKRFLSRPKIMNTNSNNNNNDIPIVQAHLVEPESTNNTYTATPTEYFEYNEETLNNNNQPIPTAPAFTTITDDSPEAQEHVTSWKARYGSDMGRIMALEEKEQIKRASANAKGFPYFERKRVEAADAIAKRRDREGFDVKGDKYFDESGLLAARKKKEQDEANAMKKMSSDSAAAKKKSGGGGGYDTEGYKVAEYETEEYECTEYKTTEYKSIYD